MSTPNELTLSVILAILSFIFIVLYGIISKPGLLRENADPKSKYSFSKFQLWLWTLVICPCFVLHWGYNYSDKGFEYINKTSLILLAISAGATLTATAIKQAQLSSLKANNQFLANNNLVGLKVASTNSNGFWTDILSDDHDQISIGRLQNFIFTVIFIVIYLDYFFNNGKCYIDFGVSSANPYLLMGISSSTYLIARGMFK